MENNRLDDMLERYGEVCTQRTAAKILGIDPRTIYTMLSDGRLRRSGTRVDVRSLVEYIENPRQRNMVIRAQRRNNAGPTISEGDFFDAARNGRWARR